MNEFKGTPGPWKYVRQAHATKPSGLGQRYAVKAAEKWVYNIAVDKTDDLDFHREIEANAHLIASAPELLEALQHIIPLANAAAMSAGKYGGLDAIKEAEAIIKQAQSAISKALGKTI